jgi:hypothetical protein
MNIYLRYVRQEDEKSRGVKKKKEKGKNGCFTPTNTKAY